MSATPKYTQQLRGKKAVVLGGSSGLGFAAAAALIEEGATVIIASSNADRVSKAVARLSDPAQQYNADPSRISGEAIDLSGPQVESRLEALFEKVGQFDHLIHSAGDSLAMSPLDQQSYEKIVKAGEVRFISAILAAKTGAKHIRKGGSITLTTGSVAVHPMVNWSVVAGFASGLHGLTRNLALDLSPLDIRVNCVSPGAVETELWNPLPADARKAMMEGIAKSVLTARVGQPEEVAQAYLWFIKDTNVTGEIAYTDSGARYGPRPGIPPH